MGDLRYVLNKEDGAKVLSLLFQSGWSGRAEIGLVGDDDLVLKVSPDGAAWREAVRVDRQTGRVAFSGDGRAAAAGSAGRADGLRRPRRGRARAFLIDDLISALEAAGVWDAAERALCDGGPRRTGGAPESEDAGVARSDAGERSRVCRGRGYAGDGVDAWLDTGLGASALADGGTGVAAGVWVTANPSPGTSQFPLGPADGDETLSMGIDPSTGDFSARVGTSTLAAFGAAPAVTGHFCVSRSSTTHVSGYHDGVLFGAAASAFTGYAGGSTALLRRLGDFHSGTVAAAWLGKDLDAGQVGALHGALAAYLGETGAV